MLNNSTALEINKLCFAFGSQLQFYCCCSELPSLTIGRISGTSIWSNIRKVILTCGSQKSDMLHVLEDLQKIFSITENSDSVLYYELLCFSEIPLCWYKSV